MKVDVLNVEVTEPTYVSSEVKLIIVKRREC